VAALYYPRRFFVPQFQRTFKAEIWYCRIWEKAKSTAIDRGLLNINPGDEVIDYSQNPLNVAVAGKQPHLGIFCFEIGAEKRDWEQTNSPLSKAGGF
jgi:hypothetical protein